MGIYSDSLQYSADTTAAQAGDLSFGDKFGGSVVGAVYSGLDSIYNTGVSVVNALGADAETANTYEQLRSMDENWASYYKQNTAAIDVGGFIATSLIPGTLAIKGLNAVRAGESANAFGRGLNFARTQQAKYLSQGLSELAQEGGSVFTSINRNKLATMAWEAADQVLQAATFETAVALTMKQSPLLADDSAWDTTKGIFTGALMGGVIGGGIGSLIIGKGFKDATKTIDLMGNKYKAVSGLKGMNLASGDVTYGILDSVVNLPSSVAAVDSSVNFAKMFPTIAENIPKKNLGSIFTKDTSQLMGNIKNASEKSAMLDFEFGIRKLAGGGEGAGAGLGDVTVAEPLATSILKKYNDLKIKGATPSDIKDAIGGDLWGLKSVSAATDDPLYKASDLMYFKKSLTQPEIDAGVKADDINSLFIKSNPYGPGDQAYNKPYVFLGSKEDWAGLKIARLGATGDDAFPSQAAAWKAGYHVAMNPDGSYRINGAGGLFKRIEDPVYDTRRFINTRTGAVTEDAKLTAADRVVAGKKLVISDSGVEAETSSGVRRQNMLKAYTADGSLDYVTARHAWASKLKEELIPDSVDIKDISLIDRLRTASQDTLDRITFSNGIEGKSLSAGNLDEFIYQVKRDQIVAAFSDGAKDIRELSYRMNVDEKWMESLVGNQYQHAADNAERFKGLSRNLEDYTSRENFIAKYQMNNQFTTINPTATNSLSTAEKRQLILDQAAKGVGGQFVTGELAWAYRVQIATRANQNAAAAVLGADKLASLPKLAQDAAKLADSTGAGATFLGAANANYGDALKIAAEYIGKKTHQWIGEASDSVVSAFSSPASKILNNKAAAAELGIVTNILRNEAGAFVLDLTDTTGKSLILRDLARIKDPAKQAEAITAMQEVGQRTHIKVESQDTMDFLKMHQGLNSDRVQREGVLVRARGHQTNKDPEVFYAPPIDTNYFQHFAFVRGIEGKAFGTSEVSMIFGRDAAELQKRMAVVDRDLFEVITKDGSERYFKAKGLYDFDQTINERNIDSSLRKSGALSNFFPETRAQNIIEDYLRFHQNQASKLVRNAVESNYSQQVAELRQLGSAYVEDATSKFSGTLRAAKSEITNPYDDVVKTMMDVSKRSEYTFFHQANEFVDALGTRAYSVLSDVTGKAQKGLLDWTEANRIAETHGIRGMYSNEMDYFLSNAPRDRNLIKGFVAKANTLLSNVVLRFDFAQAMMNVISTPLLLGTEMQSIRTLVGRDSELAGALNELTRVSVPGSKGAVGVPSTLKLQANAIRNWFGPDKDALIARYKANGDIKGIASLYHEAISDLSVSPNFSKFSEGVDRAADKVGQLTGNNWAEEFTRFVSADVMRQVTDPLIKAGKLDLQTQNAYISTFVNRVQGNYVSSQRPVAFQGVLGGAVSLFQTYSFNLMQQLFRHVENRDVKAVATMYGLQTGLFGLNGTPMFDAINTHLIGNSSMNQGHYDAYSMAPGLLGKEYGDWLMYGTASAFPAFSDKWPSLYSRGDINPRYMTILPMKPQDIPAIDASTRLVTNLLDMGTKLTKGANIGETLLQGLEHNGLNRPLAGLAQVLMGHSTTSKGSLISATSDMDIVSTASRIVGAKPMDEAIALNNMYRIKSYVAADQERMNTLGEAVKTALIGNKVPSTEDFKGFMKDYAAIGGRLEGFNGSMQRWMKDANTSVVSTMTKNLNTPYAQRLSEIMGGEPLQDYRNTAPPAPEMQQP